LPWGGRCGYLCRAVRGEPVVVAVGWLLWGSWMVTIVLLRLGLKSVAVEWQV
jgi:hypothetical protein